MSSMPTLQSCELWGLLDQNGAQGGLANFDLRRDALGPDHLQEAAGILRRAGLTAPGLGSATALLRSGALVLSRQKVTGALPAWLMYDREAQRVVSVVNLSHWDRGRGDSPLDLPPRTLSGLVSWAGATYAMKQDWARLVDSAKFSSGMASAYAFAVARALEKQTALSLRPERAELARVVAAYFFFQNHLGLKGGPDLWKLAYSVTGTGRTAAPVPGSARWTGMASLVANLNELVPGLSTLTLRNLVDGWIGAYGQSSILALEYAPALAGCAGSSVCGFRLIRDEILEQGSGAGALSMAWGEVASSMARVQGG